MNLKRPILLICAAFLLLGPSSVLADLDWGGGITQFQTSSGAPLTEEDGMAMLISVKEGAVIDFTSFNASMAQNLFETGAALIQGANTNIVMALSNVFVDGYLLLTSVPDLSTETQKALGAEADQDLYVVIWDRNTFSGDRPVIGSRFVTLQLFKDGNPNDPAKTFGPDLPNFADNIYPEKSIDEKKCETSIVNTFPGDIDGTLSVDLRDAIAAMQIASCMTPSASIRLEADCNGDGKIGIQEVITILKRISR